jgi:type II secretory pathway pseudopilin PulG
MRADRQRIHPRARRQAGFTLVELTMTLIVVIMVLTGVLALFDANSELARVQTHVANMNQSLRVAQYEMVRNVRMSGRGPFPQGNFPAGLAVAVDNNVDPNTRIKDDDDLTRIVPDTDVLTIRGVLTNPLYQFNPTAGVYSVRPDPANATEGTLIISNRTPTGIPQDLAPFKDLMDAEDPQNEALLVVSPLDDALYAVVELVVGDSSYIEETVNGVTTVTQVTLELKMTDGERTDEYRTLSPNGTYPPNMATAAFAGILEEYRYYIREVHETRSDTNSPLTPRLSKARVYPGTDEPHGGNNGNLRLDIADNVLDLQVALGIDTNNDTLITESEPPDAQDDWLYNSADDDDTDTAKWVGTPPSDLRNLYYVRINTMVRTDRPDRGFLADLLTTLEDRAYATTHEYNSDAQRAHRRRVMQSVVGTRNVP